MLDAESTNPALTAATLTLTIEDNDGPAPVVVLPAMLTLNAAPAPAEGGEAVTATLDNPAPADGTRVTLTTGGTATLDADYTLSSTTAAAVLKPKDSDGYKVVNCPRAQPVFDRFGRLARGKVISVTVLRPRRAMLRPGGASDGPKPAHEAPGSVVRSGTSPGRGRRSTPADHTVGIPRAVRGREDSRRV